MASTAVWFRWDPQALADAIELSLDHPFPREQSIARARDFSVERAVEQYLRVLFPEKYRHGKLLKKMEKKKITFIITALGIGGAEMMLLRLLKALDQDKYEISLITLKSGGALEKEFLDLGIPLISAEMNSIGGTVRGFSKVKSVLNKIQPNIVFCWMYHANLIGGLAAKSCHVSKIYWNIRNSGLKQMWKSPITAAVIKIGALLSGRIPDLIIVNSHQAKENHIRMGYEKLKMQVIHNGIDTSVFQPDPEARRIIRKELNTPDLRHCW